jgi:hypothetical protein
MDRTACAAAPTAAAAAAAAAAAEIHEHLRKHSSTTVLDLHNAHPTQQPLPYLTSDSHHPSNGACNKPGKITACNTVMKRGLT